MPVTTPAKMHRQRLKSSSMTTLLFSHPACEDHIPDLGHPENPGRLRAIAQALADGEFGALLRREAPRAEEEQIARVHPGSFVPELLARSEEPTSELPSLMRNSYAVFCLKKKKN